MKAGWTEVPLGDATTFMGGGTPSKQNKELWNGDVPWVSPKDMKSETVIDSQDRITDAAVEGSAAKFIPQGSILIVVRSGILARTIPLALSGTRLTINQDLKALTPREGVESRYLFYFLRSQERVLLDRVSRGATVHRLKTDDIKGLSIPLPPIKEQRRIVAVLDEAFERLARARANVEANVADVDELFARMREVRLVGSGDWITARVGDLAEIKHGYAFKSQWFADTGEYKLLTPGNFYETGGYREPARGQKYYTGEVPGDFVLHAGDLVMAMTEQAEGLLGSSFLVPETGVFLHNQRIGLFQPTGHHDWDASFLGHVFNLSSFREAVQATASGVKVRHTSPKKIGEITVRLPRGLEEQRKIARELDDYEQSLSSLRSCYSDQLADAEKQRNAILATALAGELT